MEDNKAVLYLEDGTLYQGKSCGKIGSTIGEICFATSMTGYQELFTDPSYYGQILVSTNVHIGNYGIKHSESESDMIRIAGLVCRNFTNPYSRERADQSIQNYFIDNNLVGITDVDTRALVRHIRQKGAMNGIISSETDDVNELKRMLSETPNMEGLELSTKVTTDSVYEIGNPDSTYKLAVLDLGVKRNILRNFEQRDCYMKVYPAKTPYEVMKAENPDGFFISNGPGDPAAMDYAVDTVKKILDDNHPLFGICLGHQIIARAIGLPTYKMHHGHRGCNHPVKNIDKGTCEISTQNHGFAVDYEALKSSPNASITHINLNDFTVEGFKVNNKKAFCVQYHPEAAPGPHDSRYLFDDFIQLIQNS